ncbi:DUF4199 domain-containing protein [Polaribacter sp. Hel1_85]|uniref:DUF4199 domain-containing protein n=1 Tax=Polaribacter sp. Hel1_85 TaxID=1250005 RepID=UPI00052DAE01|nr:DUF4199 domain-containing protein [Polaribacter sp. Hel1_85]KGL63095.1 conserved hypothetical membrane protein [Polaribacter sp. Hel1_85]
MENQASSKSIILNYGLYLGVIGIIVHLALFASGSLIELQWVNSLASFIAMIALIIIGIKKFKEANGGFISWGQGVKIGMGITMISAVIAIVYTLIFMNYIDPTYQQQAMEVQQTAWLDSGMTEEQIEGATEMANKFQTPGILSAMILAMSAFLGFVISAIIAAVMKKSEEENY